MKNNKTRLSCLFLIIIILSGVYYKVGITYFSKRHLDLYFSSRGKAYDVPNSITYEFFNEFSKEVQDQDDYKSEEVDDHPKYDHLQFDTLPDEDIGKAIKEMYDNPEKSFIFNSKKIYNLYLSHFLGGWSNYLRKNDKADLFDIFDPLIVSKMAKRIPSYDRLSKLIKTKCREQMNFVQKLDTNRCRKIVKGIGSLRNRLLERGICDSEEKFKSPKSWCEVTQLNFSGRIDGYYRSRIKKSLFKVYKNKKDDWSEYFRYFSTISITTVGYGDIRPKSLAAQKLTEIQVLIFISVFALIFSLLGVFLSELIFPNKK